MLLVLLMTMATASLSASFAVFLVRERSNKSKHVQTVSGAPPTAFWASVYLWDLINYAASAAGMPSLVLGAKMTTTSIYVALPGQHDLCMGICASAPERYDLWVNPREALLVMHDVKQYDLVVSSMHRCLCVINHVCSVKCAV